MGCWIWGFWCGVWGLGFGGLGCGVWDFGILGLGFGVEGLGCGVWGLWFGVWGLGFGVWGLGFGVWGLGFEVWGLGPRRGRPCAAWLRWIISCGCTRRFKNKLSSWVYGSNPSLLERNTARTHPTGKPQSTENNSFTETFSGSEAGSYLRLIDFCITQLKARG